MAAPPSHRPPRPFAVPGPIRRLFAGFPLLILPSEPLPAAGPPAGSPPRLYIFARGEQDAREGRPSWNPSCLRWQTYLRIAGVPVELVASSNHASPSGALPFLMPASSAVPFAAAEIARYARQHAARPLHEEPFSPRLEAYRALLTQQIRPAWVCPSPDRVSAFRLTSSQLYVLYVDPSSTRSAPYLPSQRLLRPPLLRTLRAAATAEITQTTRRPLVQPARLLADAEDAFAALSALLGDEDWFSAAAAPGLFDADVFAYTHLILQEAADGEERARLRERLAAWSNLVQHQERLYERCWRTARCKGEKPAGLGVRPNVLEGTDG